MNRKKVDSLLKAAAVAGVAMGASALADLNVVYAAEVSENNGGDDDASQLDDTDTYIDTDVNSDADADIDTDTDTDIDTYADTDADTDNEKKEEDLAEDFLDQISVASDFVIYADTLTSNSVWGEWGGTAHIDGNICVNDLDNVSEGIKAGEISKGNEELSNGEDADTLKYSIVKNASDQDNNGNSGRFDYIEGGAILVVDKDYPASEPNPCWPEGSLETNTNDSSKLMVVEDANNASQVTDAVAAALDQQGKSLSDDEKAELEKKIEKQIKIKENLESIATAAQALADKDDTG